jgi:glycosyltransferase involved in cell wall biosynthesis
VNEQTNKFPYFARLWVHEPLVIWIHHLFGHLAFRQVAAPIALATAVAERMMPRIYRGLPVAAISPSTRDELVAKGFPAADVHVIPNAVDHAAYRPTSDPRAPVPTVVAVGRLEPAKGMHVLIDAVARLPGVHLVIAGIGTPSATCGRRSRASASGIASSSAASFPEAEDPPHADGARLRIGLGGRRAGVFRCSRPGRAEPRRSRRRAFRLRDAVQRHDRPARTPGDPASFAAEIQRLLADPDARERFGRAAHARAAWFSWDATADAISALLDEARGRRNGRR